MPLPLSTVLLVFGFQFILAGDGYVGLAVASIAVVNELLRALISFGSSAQAQQVAQRADGTYTIPSPLVPPRATPHPEDHE